MIALALAQLGYSAYSAYTKAQQAKEQETAYNNWLDQRQAKLDNYYAKSQNYNILNTSEGRGMMSEMKNALKNNFKSIDNSSVKTGASAESNLAAKSKVSSGVANVARSLASSSTQYKQNAENTYFNQMSNLENQRGNFMLGQINSSNTSSQNAINNGTKAASSVVSSLFDKDSTATNSTSTDNVDLQQYAGSDYTDDLQQNSNLA